MTVGSLFSSALLELSVLELSELEVYVLELSLYVFVGCLLYCLAGFWFITKLQLFARLG